MAILNGTIQHRRGADKDFDASKMRPGEFSFTTDGSRKVRAAFGPGDVKELASTEDVDKAITEGVAAIEEKEWQALENIGTGLDSSLSVEGKAADAGATGRAIDELKGDIVGLNDKKITKFYATNLGKTHLADSDNGKIMDMMLYGKSEQKQYTGYQLLNDIFEKGYIDFNTGELVESDSNLRTKFFSKIEAGKEYHIELPKDVTIEFRYYADENTYISSYYTSNSTRFSTPESATLLKAVLINNNIYSNNILLSDVMDRYIYEPYTGGIPSPNPDYPQEIKSVVNPVVKVCGKNLLDVSKATFEAGKAKLVDGEIYLNGTFDSNYDYYFFDTNNVALDLILKVNKTVTISCGSFNIGIWTKSGIKSGKSLKINPIADRLISIFVIVLSGTYENVKVPIMIEIGDTVTDYEPYIEPKKISLPYTLNAIPVSSGGNVTIDGQEYIADYVDIENKKLVRNVRKMTLTSLSSLPNKVKGKNGEYHYSFGYNMFDALKTLFNTMNGGYLYSMCENTRIVPQINELTYNENVMSAYGHIDNFEIRLRPLVSDYPTLEELNAYLASTVVIYPIEPTITDLTDEEVREFIELATYYPTTNVIVTSDQLDGYTKFNYPLSMENGWNLIKEQLGDTRDYIYDMDLQSAEAYVNSEYAVALAELEV